MTDVVLKLPIQPGAEALAFGLYLSEFMERSARWIEAQSMDLDAPPLMIRADPASGEEAKILIFQENGLAKAFSSGWERRRAPVGSA